MMHYLDSLALSQAEHGAQSASLSRMGGRINRAKDNTWCNRSEPCWCIMSSKPVIGRSPSTSHTGGRSRFRC